MQKIRLTSSVRILALVLALGAATTVSATSYNNDNHNHHDKNNHGGKWTLNACDTNKSAGHHAKRMFSGLNLSATQQQKIKSIWEKRRVSRKSMRSTHFDMLNSATFDEAKVRAMLESKQQQKIERRVSNLKARYDSFQVLTDAQKADYKMHRSNRKG
ncbi:hypothetical protein PCNPT3_09670 [Psychromonas sp. CNPT3]|uniref:Spy/CpxP family protein refolding chaperone n=1 Tax=Psychromonas sp. CNPT3 TaxID=314282 RepID=UPI00006E9159|nr:Spy/CpxP family protein refolding chaperone [Psychromonas sp. CNPT3]AGH81872.1 hypothetical protein PCNPT3_09670 [Psychromonas sp. CNPT3]